LRRSAGSTTLRFVTPTQLRAYAAVARHGSARAAAEELGVSEAAISSHTAALRRELDDPLYHRSGQGLAFTPGGLRLAMRAVEMLGLQDQTRQEVMAASQGRRILRLATTSLFAEHAAPGLIELFKTRADDLDVEMSVHGSSRFSELLATRRVDVAIAPAEGAAGDSFRRCEFLRYQLILMVGAQHRLAGKRADVETLRSCLWVLGPSAVESTGAGAQLLERFGVPETNQRIFQSHGAAISEAQQGRGIAIVPEFRARHYSGAGGLEPISAPGASAAGVWSATTLARGQAPAVADELMRFITTPRATQAMLAGTGARIDRFRPSVHITLWS
jgi:DNA-binding transcriptional LysR family regulator